MLGKGVGGGSARLGPPTRAVQQESERGVDSQMRVEFRVTQWELHKLSHRGHHALHAAKVTVPGPGREKIEKEIYSRCRCSPKGDALFGLG